MELSTVMENLTNPALLFFLLGICAVQFKSDLEIPPTSSKFISIYLLLSIGFKGGQELAHSGMNFESLSSIALGLTLATVIPVTSFFILKGKLGVDNAAAIAASYGSVSAVTFVTATSFLDFESITFSGHMIAVMAIMEAPAILVGVVLLNYFKRNQRNELGQAPFSKILAHSFTNGSVFLLLGSLIIGYLTDPTQAQGIQPFVSDIFKGFLIVFLLDMGITSGRHLAAMLKEGIFPIVFAMAMPFLHGLIALFISMKITAEPGNQMLFAILGASASYIAVPAAAKHAIPKANPGLYLPMALGITFPVNILLGIPLYYSIITAFQFPS